VAHTREREFSLADLAERSGVPERTIRFYIARGVLDGPVRSGRDAAYTDEHLAQLRSIRERQRAGLTLAQIERELPGPATAKLPEPEALWVYPVAPDVKVQIHNGVSPWRMRQLKTALEKFAADIVAEDAGEGEDR
jgi:DNA-binding transcriptional MerR regulator